MALNEDDSPALERPVVPHAAGLAQLQHVKNEKVTKGLMGEGARKNPRLTLGKLFSAAARLKAALSAFW